MIIRKNVENKNTNKESTRLDFMCDFLVAQPIESIVRNDRDF